jgi:arylsulfatase A-like enzyme
MLESVADGPFFAFVHYKDPDATGHESGSANDAYHEAVVLMDERLADLIDTLGRLRAAESTLVLVTTDHGFDGRFHFAREPQIVETWIAAHNGRLRTDIPAKLLDVTPTILDAFGIDASRISPPLEGVSLLEPMDSR